jgi:hypothetical protein
MGPASRLISSWLMLLFQIVVLQLTVSCIPFAQSFVTRPRPAPVIKLLIFGFRFSPITRTCSATYVLLCALLNAIYAFGRHCGELISV